MKKILIAGFLLLFFDKLPAQTWQPLTIPTTNDILSSSFTSDDEGWIGTTNSGSYAIIYHTADGGTSWNADTITGASGGTSFIEFITQDLGFAVVNTKAFKTTDGGDIWTQLTLPDIPYNEPCFLNQDTGFISGQYAVFKTVDGGASWTSEYMEETDNTPLYQMTFLNDSIGAAVDGAESVYTTIDGGENWYCLYCGGLWNWFFGLSYNSAGELFIAGYYDDNNYVTGYVLGGGEWWGEEGANCYPYDVHFADAYRGYAAGSCGLMVNTFDGGLTWTEETISNDEFRVVDGFNDVFVFGLDGKGYRLSYECTAAAIFEYTATDLHVQFTNQSQNTTSWLWDFGDGNSSTDLNPLHTYATAGDYEVCLTASDAACGSDELCVTLWVCEPNMPGAGAGSLDLSFGGDGISVVSGGADIPISSVIVQADGKVITGGARYSDADIIARFNPDGTLDPTFADGGLLYTPDNFTISFVLRKILLTPDQKIVAIGYDPNYDIIWIVRYNTDGSIDLTFGDDGMFSLDLIYNMSDENIHGAAIQPDGKILFSTYYSNGGMKPAIVRLTTDGSLDSTFDGDGIANLTGINDINLLQSMALQPDGKIVVAGSSNTADTKFSVFRVNPNGSIDSTFDGDGVVFTNLSSGADNYDQAYSVLVQPDGKIIAAGTAKQDINASNFALTRYLADGTLDSTFSMDGIAMFQIDGLPSWGQDAALQPDGKILIAGYFYENYSDYKHKIGLARLLSNGNLDTAFGMGGITRTSINCTYAITQALALQGGFIYVSGKNDLYDGDLFIARYLNDSCTTPQAAFVTSVTGPDVQFTDQSLDASSWLWDFGDGITSTQQSPAHIYAAEGSFNVCLTATNSCGSNMSCQALMVCDPLNTDYLYQVTGLTIQFQNQITEATSFFWDFGDGNTSTQQSPLHNFSSSGTYHVCLVESDSCATDTMCKEIVVCGTVAADFNFTVAGTMIQFNDASTNALNWSWDFGDGNFSSDQNPSHTYSQAGTYTACLVAGDDCTSDTLCQTIVTGAPCNADFTLVADTLNPGFYWGYNLATGENLIYSWTWGDGTSSTGQYPVHLYADSGFYTICQMIYDSIGGCADTFCADYTILKSSGMLEIHEINFVNYAVNVLSQASDGIEWAVFPNPFSINTTISFILPSSQKISMELFDLSGRKVRTIVNGNFTGKDSNGEEGNHSIQFSKGNLSAGIYFLKLKTESETLVKQLIIQ